MAYPRLLGSPEGYPTIYLAPNNYFWPHPFSIEWEQPTGYCI